MRISNLFSIAAALLLPAILVSCSNGNNNNVTEPTLYAGAASASLLPTVSGGRDYLQHAPGWPLASALDPDDPGIFVPVWDQGKVNVGNGNSDGSWVHDDVRVTAVALERDGQRMIFITSNTYMHLKADVDEIVRRVQAALPEPWAGAEILVSSAHNHHGPETAFGPNAQWYEMAAGQIVAAAVSAVASVEPASASVAAGEHNYGSVDQRDPRIYDSRLNVMAFNSIETGQSIAILVQWNAHPEVTLGWEPPADAAGLAEACAIKGWKGSDCTAEDRYFSGDFVGVLETRLKAAHGGEVAFFNGALGVLTGPLHASTWRVDAEHPVGDGKTVPEGALPLAECNKANQYECQSFAKTESTGTELANAVDTLLEKSRPMVFESFSVRRQSFYSRVTNLGFRVLAAEGELGWMPMQVYNCDGKPFTDDNCVNTGTETVDDPVLTPLLGYQVARGDVLKTQVIHVDFGDVGMLFLPGEVSSELVIGLPEDFYTAPPEKYNQNPDEHSVGAAYVIPGHYLSLVDESIMFTIGLGMDEVGYFVPASEYRLQCHPLSLSALPGASCQDLADRGLIESPTWVGGITCQKVTDDAAYFASLGADGPAVRAVCYYGQMVARSSKSPRGITRKPTRRAGTWSMICGRRRSSCSSSSSGSDRRWRCAKTPYQWPANIAQASKISNMLCSR
ncbi:MAG: hypothetical protein R3E50_03000 [Halioglobus sp.]